MQRAGGDAEVMDGEGGADLGGQLLSKRPQPLYLRIAHLDGVHMDDRLDVELLVEFPLDVVNNIMDLQNIGIGGHLGVDAHHPPPRAVIMDDQIMDAHHLPVAEDHILNGLDGFRFRSLTQKGVQGGLGCAEAGLQDEQGHQQTDPAV